MAPSLCGAIVRSRRGMLAFGWSIVTILTVVAFIMALVFTVKHKNYIDDYDWGDEEDEDNDKAEVAVTSRAMGFAALWTAVLAGIMAVFGTVVLGYQSLSGEYYWCCAGNVHSTTPLSLGAFIGSLLMFANLTLVCSVLFGEFEIEDNQSNGWGQNQDQEEAQDSVERSSMAFSVMCMFLTVIYAGYAALVFSFSDELLEENRADIRNEALSPSEPDPAIGYIGGERFDVMGNPMKDHNSAGFIQTDQRRHSLFGPTRGEDSERGFMKPDQSSHSGSMG